MSTYTDYDAVSRNYDATRRAVGIEIVLGYLAALTTPLHEQVVLDAGGGTGNYSAILQHKVKRVVCADFSPGMLARARTKLPPHSVVQCDIAELPFAAGVFDGIVANQCIHHLDAPESGFPKLRRFLKRAVSCLKPDGLLLINTITHEQLRDGVWWGKLIAPAVDRMQGRFPSVGELGSMLADAGLEVTARVVPTDAIIQPRDYFDGRSLYSKEFRDGDSHFGLLTESELEGVLAKVRELETRGQLDAYIQERDRLRQTIGQFTYFVARRSTHA